MRAQSLQINMLGGCDARCPFCISRCTPKTGARDNQRLFDNLDRALRLAAWHRVDSVMVTGTGEPTLDDGIADIVIRAREFGFPSIELQTNGMRLANEPRMLVGLASIGLTGLAVSIASPDPESSRGIMGVTHDYLDLMSKASGIGLLCRVTLNLVRGELDVDRLIPWVDLLVSRGVHQLTLRELGIPSHNLLATDAADRVVGWIAENAMRERERDLIHRHIVEGGTMIRTTPFGSSIYDYRGLSTCVANCMSENPEGDDIRSMILFPDGHVRSSWQLPGSILL